MTGFCFHYSLQVKSCAIKTFLKDVGSIYFLLPSFSERNYNNKKFFRCKYPFLKVYYLWGFVLFCFFHKIETLRTGRGLPLSSPILSQTTLLYTSCYIFVELQLKSTTIGISTPLLWDRQELRVWRWKMIVWPVHSFLSLCL